jgi:hypothetical protein
VSDWVTEVTEEAMRRLMAHADKVGLHNTEEFTLRAFFMSAAHDLLVPRRPRFATEWKKFDLLVQLDNTFTIVECKYYVVREKLTMDGIRDGYKGGAGPKNEAEFYTCLAKLRENTPGRVDDARLVLVYERESGRASRYSFDGSYGHLQAGSDLSDVASVRVGSLEGRILRPQRSLLNVSNTATGK